MGTNACLFTERGELPSAVNRLLYSAGDPARKPTATLATNVEKLPRLSATVKRPYMERNGEAWKGHPGIRRLARVDWAAARAVVAIQ